MKLTIRYLFLATLAGLLSCAWAGAAPVKAPELSPALQKGIKKIEATIEPSPATRGQTATWKLTIELAEGWHTYPTHQRNADSTYVTAFVFPTPNGKVSSPDVVFVGNVADRASKINSQDGDTVFEGVVTWERPLVVQPKTTPGEKTVKVKVKTQVCTDKKCTPFNLEIEAPLTISSVEPVEVDPKVKDQFLHPEDGEVGNSSSAPPENYPAELEAIRAQIKTHELPHTGLLAFLLTGVFWGAVSLVTPCVFPMIPITVSFFLKQSDREHHKPVTMAMVYCSTIVIVLTIAAVGLLSFFKWLSINPVMNFALGGLFVAFALSLFGMYDLELPSGLARFTSSREGKGGLAGTMFMALTFTIVSFACVAPFLGGFGGTAASSNLTLVDRVLGGLAFSITFASPFFVLALFPSLLKKVPKSGTWLNSVKVVMGFLELAAALNFFRAGELVLTNGKPTIFTYDLVLGLCIGLSFLCGGYLLGLYRLPHDTPTEHLGVLRLMFSLVFLGMGFYLLPAMFRYNAEGEKQRPGGTIYAWFESFLLPESREAKGNLKWTARLKEALDDARANKKYVFVDFTGVTCKNCNYNEANVFSKPEIQDLFKSYKLVQLFTDTVPSKYYPPEERSKTDTNRQRDDADANQQFQNDAFGTTQLPLYVILEPLANGSIRVVGEYSEGKINSESEFAQFLKGPLDAAREGSKAQASRF